MEKIIQTYKRGDLVRRVQILSGAEGLLKVNNVYTILTHITEYRPVYGSVKLKEYEKEDYIWHGEQFTISTKNTRRFYGKAF